MPSEGYVACIVLLFSSLRIRRRTAPQYALAPQRYTEDAKVPRTFLNTSSLPIWRRIPPQYAIAPQQLVGYASTIQKQLAHSVVMQSADMARHSALIHYRSLVVCQKDLVLHRHIARVPVVRANRCIVALYPPELTFLNNLQGQSCP